MVVYLYNSIHLVSVQRTCCNSNQITYMADSAPATACAYSAADEQFDACTCSAYSITAEGLFGAAFPLLCSQGKSVDTAISYTLFVGAILMEACSVATVIACPWTRAHLDESSPFLGWLYSSSSSKAFSPMMKAIVR